jgi:hypothetical protein
MIPRIVQLLDYGYCARATVHLLREREDRYPAHVTKGTMTAAQAAEGLEFMRAIVAQWRWVTDPATPPPPPFDPETGEFGALNYLLAAELDNVAQRARSLADREPDRFETAEMADLCEALAWYQADYIPGVARIVMHVTSERARRAAAVDHRLAA